MIKTLSSRNVLQATAAALLLTMAASTLAATSANAASRPSFSCRSADHITEYAICSSWWLAKLDRRLAYWYGRSMHRARHFGYAWSERQDQRRWLRQRNACGGYKKCIARKYRQRIRVLRNRATHV
ncbi:MAG: hypothetical protein AAGB04_29490 [Pseudomonadota bacterium]